MVAAASVRAAVDTTAILPNFNIMTRLPLVICLPTETSNKAQAGISSRPSRDISRYGKSEDRWVTRKHFCFGSDSEVGRRNHDFRCSPNNGKFVEASGASALPRSMDIRIDDAKGELGDCVGSRGVADPGIQEALGLPCKRGARASRSLEMISFSSWPSAETLLPFALQSLPVLAGGFCSAKLSSENCVIGS